MNTEYHPFERVVPVCGDKMPPLLIQETIYFLLAMISSCTMRGTIS